MWQMAHTKKHCLFQSPAISQSPPPPTHTLRCPTKGAVGLQTLGCWPQGKDSKTQDIGRSFLGVR